MIADPASFAVGRLAHRLSAGYYAFLVAHHVAANPKAINSLPPSKSLGADLTGEISGRTRR